MATSGKRGGGGKRREVEKGVRVSAVASTRGPPSTTVHVELEPERLREEAGPFEEVRRVQATLPEEREGRVRWSSAELHKEAPSSRPGEERVDRYSATHLGPSDAGRLGVGVDLETDAGTLRAPARSEAYAVRLADKPRTRQRVPAPGAGKRKKR